MGLAAVVNGGVPEEGIGNVEKCLHEAKGWDGEFWTKKKMNVRRGQIGLLLVQSHDSELTSF